MKLTLEGLFHPAVPDQTNLHHVPRKAHPDSSNTFPYEKETPPKQTEEELDSLLTVENFLGGVPKKDNSPAMSARKLSYAGGDTDGFGASTMKWSNYHLNPNGIEKTPEDSAMTFSMTGKQDGELEKESELLNDINEMRNGRMNATQDGNKMITTKDGWSNGMPSDTGVEEQTEEEVKDDLGITEKLSLKRVFEWVVKRTNETI